MKKPHSLKLPELPTKVNNQARTQKQQFDEIHHWLNPDVPFALSPCKTPHTCCFYFRSLIFTDYRDRHLVEEQRQQERREVNMLPQQPPANIRSYSSESSDVLSGELGITATEQLYSKVTRLTRLENQLEQLRKDFHQSNLENSTNFEKIFEGIGLLINAQPGGRHDTVKAVQQEDENESQPRSSNTQQDQPHPRKAVGGHCIIEQGLNVPDQPGELSFATLAARYIEPHSVPDPGPSVTQQMYPFPYLPGLPNAVHASPRAIPAFNDIHPSSLIDRHGIGINAATETWRDQYAASGSPYSAILHSGQNSHVGHNPDWQRGHVRVRSRA